MKRLAGKVAVVTGAASGIGSATARLFADEGCRVVIADIQDERGARLARELGEQACYVHADVTREDDVRSLIEHALSQFGRVDCLFNNAGAAGIGGPIEEITADAYDQSMALLLRSVFLGIKHASPVMKRQGSGSIVSTASVAGLQAGFGPHIYSAAKAAVIQLTRTVAMELGESGVRVNCICPGGIATPIFARNLGYSGEALDRSVDVVRTLLAQMQPIRRAGLPEDIAKAALWLASDDSSFVNGEAIVVDGGLTGGRQWSTVLEQRRQMQAALAQAVAGETGHGTMAAHPEGTNERRPDMAFTIDTPIGELLDNPATLAVLDKHMPGLSTNAQIGMARSMGLSLRSVAQFSGGKITDDLLAAAATELAAL